MSLINWSDISDDDFEKTIVYTPSKAPKAAKKNEASSDAHNETTPTTSRSSRKRKNLSCVRVSDSSGDELDEIEQLVKLSSTKTGYAEWQELQGLDNAIHQVITTEKGQEDERRKARSRRKKEVYARYKDNEWADVDEVWKYVQKYVDTVGPPDLILDFHVIDFGVVKSRNQYKDRIVQEAASYTRSGLVAMARDENTLHTLFTMKDALLAMKTQFDQLPEIWPKWALQEFLTAKDSQYQQFYFDLFISTATQERRATPADIYRQVLQSCGYLGRENVRVLERIPIFEPPTCVLRAIRTVLRWAANNVTMDAEHDSVIEEFIRDVITLACDVQVETAGGLSAMVDICREPLALLISRPDENMWSSKMQDTIKKAIIKSVPFSNENIQSINERARIRVLNTLRRTLSCVPSLTCHQRVKTLHAQIAVHWLTLGTPDVGEINSSSPDAILSSIIAPTLLSDPLFNGDVPGSFLSTDIDKRRYFLLLAAHASFIYLPYFVERVDVRGTSHAPRNLAARASLYKLLNDFRTNYTPTVDTLAFFSAVSFACTTLQASYSRDRAVV
jgi:hypothetical protein